MQESILHILVKLFLSFYGKWGNLKIFWCAETSNLVMHKDYLKSSVSFSAKNFALAQKLGPEEIFEGPEVSFLGAQLHFNSGVTHYQG
jgi:hypothetical protein